MPPARTILVDAHVHFHRCFDLESFLDGAVGHFQAGARQLGLSGDAAGPAGCLMMTESRDADAFAEFHRLATPGDEGSPGAGPAPAADRIPSRVPQPADDPDVPPRRLPSSRRPGDGSLTAPERWTFQPTREADSVRARRRDGATLVLVAGRQVAARGGLEVLALAARRAFDDGGSLRRAVDDALEAGAIPVLPWGFGKWWLGRGRRVRRLLESEVGSRVFLGDNGGRPALGPRPRLFRVAADLGRPVLPGSDPLPFRWQRRHAGRYGFALSVDWDDERPAASLRRALAGLDHQPAVYGRREALPGFLRAQVGMQLVGRRRR